MHTATSCPSRGSAIRPIDREDALGLARCHGCAHLFPIPTTTEVPLPEEVPPDTLDDWFVGPDEPPGGAPHPEGVSAERWATVVGGALDAPRVAFSGGAPWNDVDRAERVRELYGGSWDRLLRRLEAAKRRGIRRGERSLPAVVGSKERLEPVAVGFLSLVLIVVLNGGVWTFAGWMAILGIGLILAYGAFGGGLPVGHRLEVDDDGALWLVERSRPTGARATRAGRETGERSRLAEGEGLRLWVTMDDDGSRVWLGLWTPEGEVHNLSTCPARHADWLVGVAACMSRDLGTEPLLDPAVVLHLPRVWWR